MTRREQDIRARYAAKCGAIRSRYYADHAPIWARHEDGRAAIRARCDAECAREVEREAEELARERKRARTRGNRILALILAGRMRP